MDGINGKVDTAEERISEFENIAIETIQNETGRGEKKEFKEMKSSVCCGTTSSSLIYM